MLLNKALIVVILSFLFFSVRSYALPDFDNTPAGCQQFAQFLAALTAKPKLDPEIQDIIDQVNRLSAPARQNRSPLVFSSREASNGIGILFYLGDEMPPEAIDHGILNTHREILEIRTAYDPERRIGAIGIRGNVGHDLLVKWLPPDRIACGGSRHINGETRNSLVLSHFTGLEIEEKFFDVQIP